jgi:hypothetical protein
MKPGLAVLVCGLLLGCGGGEDTAKRVTVYPVTGTITTPAGPLDGAAVTFAPKTTGQPTATGRTNAQGEFTLTTYEAGDGAAAGDYAVVVMKATAAPVSPADAAHEAETAGTAVDAHAAAQAGGERALLLPSRYTNAMETPLRATVEADKTNHFPLKVE